MLCPHCYSTMVQVDRGYECQMCKEFISSDPDDEYESEFEKRYEEDRLASWHHEQRERFKADPNPTPADDASDSTNGR